MFSKTLNRIVVLQFLCVTSCLLTYKQLINHARTSRKEPSIVTGSNVKIRKTKKKTLANKHETVFVTLSFLLA